MATVCVTVPDDQALRIINAFAEREQITYTTMEEGVAIVQNATFRWLGETTREVEARKAATDIINNPNDPLANATMTQG